MTINLDLNLSDVNQPQTISAPSSSQPLDNLLRQVAPLLGGLGAQAAGGGSSGRPGGAFGRHQLGDAQVPAERDHRGQVQACASQ